MPILKIKNESYFGKNTLENVIEYICRSGYVGGLAVDTDPHNAVFQMALVKALWHKTDPNRRQVRHFIFSFSDNEYIGLDEAFQYGYAISQYYGDRFQIIFGLHIDTNIIHLHFAVNTVSYIDGKMFSEGYVDYLHFRDYIQSLMPQWEVTMVADN